MSNPQCYPKFQAVDSDGDFLVGGLVYTYEPATTTAKATYSDVTLQTANANPVVLDSRGEATIYLSGPTKFVLKDSDGTTIWTQDFVGTQAVNWYDASLYGTTGTQAAIAAAIAQMAGNDATLYLASGNWAITSDLTITDNVTLWMETGAYFTVANTKTLTINGPINAGPVKIFAWTGTGTVSIKGSPTVDCPIEWWGAVTGTTEDNAAVFNKVDDCINGRQNILMGPGVYRIASTVTWAGNTEGTVKTGFGFQGVGDKTILMVDVGAAVGMTFGAAGTASYGWRIGNFFVAAEAASCTNALVFYRTLYSKVGTLWFGVGSTDYAMKIVGSEHTDWDLQFGTQTQVCTEASITIGTMANALSVTADGTYHANSYNRLKFSSSGTAIGTYGIYANDVYDNWYVTGCIENCTTPIYLEDCYGWNFENIHFETLTNGPIIKDCKQISFTNCHPKADPSYVKGNCSAITFKSCILYGLTVYPGCYGVVLINTQIQAGGLTDLSGAVEMIGTSSYYAAALNTQANKYGLNRQNILHNSGLQRWQSGTVIPDGWTKPTNTTWTQCGTGLADTNKPPHATYSAQAVTTDASEISNYTFSTEQLQRCFGECITGSVMAMLTSGQTFADSNGLLLSLTPTVAAWSDEAAYAVGQAVYETGTGSTAMNFVCITAGTSAAAGSEPTWASYNYGDEVTDGTVTWVACPRIATSLYGQPMGTSQADGLWYKVTAGPLYVPTNATALNMQLTFNYQTDTSDGTCYIGEPGVWVGNQPSRGLHYGHSEHPTFIQVGANKLSWGAAVPGAGTGWHQDGDIMFYNAPATGGIIGWVCTTSGEAAAATWNTLPQSSVGLTGGTLTLATGAGATTTTVNNAAVTATSRIMLNSTHANSAVAGIYVSAKNAGVSFVVTHPANPGADAAMDYLIFN